jgi:hypothetical protein
MPNMEQYTKGQRVTVAGTFEYGNDEFSYITFGNDGYCWVPNSGLTPVPEPSVAPFPLMGKMKEGPNGTVIMEGAVFESRSVASSRIGKSFVELFGEKGEAYELALERGWQYRDDDTTIWYEDEDTVWDGKVLMNLICEGGVLHADIRFLTLVSEPASPAEPIFISGVFTEPATEAEPVREAEGEILSQLHFNIHLSKASDPLHFDPNALRDSHAALHAEVARLNKDIDSYEFERREHVAKISSLESQLAESRLARPDGLRPCEYDSNGGALPLEKPKWEKAYWHMDVQWAGYNNTSSGRFQEAGPMVLVEDEKGVYHECEPRYVRFPDRQTGGRDNG